MTKFADELFADLMRKHGQELEILDRPLPRQAIRPLTARPRPPRPLAGHPRRPRRQPAWLAPVAAATGVTLAVGLAVVLGGRVHHGRHTGRVTDSRAETAYLLNAIQGTVAPISPVTGKLGTPVRVGPRGSVIRHGKRRLRASRIWQDLILPDGTTNYALYLSGRGKGETEVLRRTSLVTGETGPPIHVGRPASVVITPDGRTAYLNYASVHESTVRPVSLATGTVGKPILRAPEALTPWITLTMAPDGRTVYASYARAGQVIPISTATNTPGKPIPVPGAWGAVAFTRDGRTAFVIGRRKGVGQTVTPISTATKTPGRTIIIEPHPGQLIFAPDGKTVYNVDFPGTSVTPISIRTGRVGKPILLHGGHAGGNGLITPDGRTLYIAGQGEVTPVSLATGTVGKSLSVPGALLGLVITPDGRTIYASSTAGELQLVTPISTATGAAGKPIRTTAPTIEVLVPGAQNAL